MNSKSFYTTGTATSPTILNNLNCNPSKQLVGGTAYGIASSSFLSGRTFCNYDGDAFTDVQTAGEDFSLLGIGKLRINENLSAFGEFAFTDSKRTYRSPARTISGTSPTTNFLVGGIAESFQAILPIGHPDNPYKDARTAVAYRFENLKTGTDLINQNARLLGGFKGVQGAWDWETAVLWNQSRREETSYGFLYLPTLRKLITENRSLASLAADPTITKDLTNVGIA